MPPKKRQRTASGSKATTHGKENENPSTRKEPASKSKTSNSKDASKDSTKYPERDVKDIPNDQYICLIRPLSDYKAENWGLEPAARRGHDEIFDQYCKDSDPQLDNNFVYQPAKDHPDWKWVMQWQACKNWQEYKVRAKYCCPDNFGMYICNDWEGWGLMELMENMINDFDKALKKKKTSLQPMWGAMSTIIWWLSAIDEGAFINNEDGEKVCHMTEMLGFTLLRALEELSRADELKSGSAFPDIPIMITMLLEWSHDLHNYGIKDNAVEWRPHAIAYFKKGKFDVSMGTARTARLLQGEEDQEPDDESKLPKKDEKDPWCWAARLKKYKKLRGHGGRIGGTQYDITKMSRRERASHAFDNKDPLADIPIKELKNNNIDLG